MALFFVAINSVLAAINIGMFGENPINLAVGIFNALTALLFMFLLAREF